MVPRSRSSSPALVAALAGLLLLTALPLAAPPAEAQAGTLAVGAAAGAGHSCALLADGNVDCYGDNSQGQAADYAGGDAAAVEAGYYHTCVLTTGGDVHCWGATGDRDLGQVVDRTLGDAVAVAAGGFH